MKLAILFGSAVIAGSAALVPQTLWAQDQRSETEAIVKDYLATHPDEVGEIVKGYFIRHPEAVGQILAELIKAPSERCARRRPASRSPIAARPSPPMRQNFSLRRTK